MNLPLVKLITGLNFIFYQLFIQKIHFYFNILKLIFKF